MNRRTLKKHCIRAKAFLIAKHDYREEAFSPANGEESVYAPTRMERRFVRHGFLDPGPLKGTPLLWERTSYECDDWDCSLPSEILAHIQSWENFDYAEYERASVEAAP